MLANDHLEHRLVAEAAFRTENSQPVDEIRLENDRRRARASEHSRRGRDVSPKFAPLELGDLSSLNASTSRLGLGGT